MNNNITLSIIVPAYNIEDFIRECLDSILSQLQAHHELIVVNDGSTDKTTQIIRKIKSDYKKNNFYILEQHNQGLSDARNHGIAIAKGDYIVLVDGDDILLPDSLTLLDNTIQLHHPDVVIYDYRTWYFHGDNRKVVTKQDYAENTLITDKDIILNKFFLNENVVAWSKAFKRSIHQKFNNQAYPSGCFFEDMTATPLLMACCESLIYLPHILIDYRLRIGSITHSRMTEKKCLNKMTALVPVKAFYEENKITDTVILSYDMYVCAVYWYTLKMSYQLSIFLGNKVRKKIKSIFFELLFHDYDMILSLLEKGNHTQVKIASRIKLALSNNRKFHYKMILLTLIKKFKSFK